MPSKLTVASRTGVGSGTSPEMDACSKLLGHLRQLPFEPIVLCSAHAFDTWTEIFSGVPELVPPSDRVVFVATARRGGKIAFTLTLDTVRLRSGMAEQSVDRRVLLLRYAGLTGDDAIEIIDHVTALRLGLSPAHLARARS